MSTYEDQCDDNNVICPYCGDEYQPEPEDNSEDERVVECDECKKKYRLYDSYSVTHFTNPDCTLNDGTHIWESQKLRGGTFHDFCSVCGVCRPNT